MLTVPGTVYSAVEGSQDIYEVKTVLAIPMLLRMMCFSCIVLIKVKRVSACTCTSGISFGRLIWNEGSLLLIWNEGSLHDNGAAVV